MDVLWNLITSFFGAMNGMAALNVIAIHEQLDNAIDPIWGPSFENLYAVFQGPAMMLLVLYMCIDLLDKVSSENFSLDTLVLDFSKMIFGIALINNGITIVHGLYGISEMCCEKIISYTTDTNVLNFNSSVTPPSSFESMWDVVWFALKGIVNVIAAPVGAGVTSVSVVEYLLIVIISNICVSIMKYTRAVRLGMRMVMAPFVFADVVGHGFNSNAMHFLKVLLALCMEGPIICVMLALLPAAIASNPANLICTGLVLTVLVIKLLFDSHKMAQELFL